MTDELEVEQETLNPEEGQDSNLEESTDTTEADDELAKAKEIARNQEIRAKKAEAELKALKNAPDKEKKENYSLQDIRALNDVHDDNVKKLVDYSKFLGVSVAEAKKTDEMQTYLKNENEKRDSAQKSNIGASRRGASSGADIIEQAKRGEDVDMDALAEARIEQKKKDRGLK